VKAIKDQIFFFQKYRRGSGATALSAEGRQITFYRKTLTSVKGELSKAPGNSSDIER